MDSNFQVKITADLGDLAAKIKNIESTLKNLDASFKATGEKAKTSFKAVSSSLATAGVDMNRVRLATFAFGQVIRDAGFFSQSFGLGLLAISNNVPILIDQLVMLSGVSAGVGAAISLMGSFLTAGLTVFAYWAQGVQSSGKSVGGEIQRMALDSQNVIGKLVDYLSKPPASEILNKVIGGILTGFEAIKGYFNAFVNLVQIIWDKFGNDISDGTSRTFQLIQGTLENTLNVLVNFIRLATGLISGDFDLMGKAIVGIFKNIFNQVVNIWSNLIKNLASGIGYIVSVTQPALGAAITQSGKNFVDFANKNKFATESILDFNFNLKDSIKNLKFATPEQKKHREEVDKIAKIYKTLADELKVIKYDLLSSDLEKANSTLEAHEKALKNLLIEGVEPLSAEYKKMESAMLSAMMALNDQEGKLFAAKLLTSSIAAKAEESAQKELDAKKKQAEIEKQLSALGADSVAGELTDDPTNAILEQRNALFLKQIKNINDTKSLLMDMGNILVGPLAGAFETMMQTGEFSFKAIIKSLGQVIAKLMAAIAAAAILAIVISIATGGAAGGGKSFSTAFSGLMSGKGMFPGLKFANGGIVSGPTSALIGEYPGARNNPEVVAPLDKLKSLIGDSGAGSSGGFTGQLETRISGNDLVILMNRANKNRNGYY